MKTLVIVAHPHLDQSKVNKAWVERLKQEASITVHDLYAAYPTFEIDVQKEQQLMMEHDRVVFQFPFYWYSTPAILKQWQDAVLTYGWAYGAEGNKLHNKEFMLAISAGGPEQAYARDGYNFFTIEELTAPLHAMANLTGMKYLAPFRFHGAGQASEEQIKHSAVEYVKHILNPDLAK